MRKKLQSGLKTTAMERLCQIQYIILGARFPNPQNVVLIALKECENKRARLPSIQESVMKNAGEGISAQEIEEIEMELFKNIAQRKFRGQKQTGTTVH